MKNDFSIWKIAIIASKKRFNKAVTRNKVKRQVKAIIRELSINLKSNNIVLVVKEEWLNKSFSENKMILNKLLTKLSKGVG